jgi:uncharacterized protein
MKIELHHDEQGRRFHTEVDGHPARLDYARHQDGTLDLVHTEVDPALRGKGVGEALVRGVLDEARRRGVKIVPRCPFVQKFLERHPEDRDLVA